MNKKVLLVSVDTKLIEYFRKTDKEVMEENNRPFVLVLRLLYRHRNHDFAIPIRSNIAPNVPVKQYFNLPPRAKTKPYHHHGIHFIKVIPVNRKYLQTYKIDKSVQGQMVYSFVEKHLSEIVKKMQQYLSEYENGNRPQYSTDIDALIALLTQYEQLKN